MTARSRTRGAAAVLAVAVIVGTAGAVPTSAIAAGTPCEPTLNDDGVGTFSDFDGDDLPDGAFAEPSRTVEGRVAAGAVRIAQSCAADVVLTARSLGFAPVAGARFGASVTAYPFDNDSFTDLVVSAPRLAGTGVVAVVFGSAFGLGEVKPVQRLTVPGLRQGDEFGHAVAVSPTPTVTNVVIGAPGVDVGRATNAGAVFVLRRAASSATITDVARRLQGHNLVPGRAERNDRFGEVLSTGVRHAPSTASGGRPTVAVGVPHEDVGRLTDAGAVYVLHGDALERAEAVSQASKGVPGAAEKGDRFGQAVVGAEGGVYAGVPGEDLGRTVDAGGAQRLSVSRSYAVKGSGLRTQNSTGVAGTSETGDQLGASLALVSGDHDEEMVLAGAPGEDVGRAKDAGAVTILAFKTTCAGSCRTRTQDSPFVPGRAETGDRLGAALTPRSGSSQGDTRFWALVGAPGEDTGAGRDAGALYDTGMDDVASSGATAGARLGEVASAFGER